MSLSSGARPTGAGRAVEPSGAAGFADRVVAVVAATRAGQVVTYGEVAAEAGRPRAARAVGAILRAAGGASLPWWRVVTAHGRLVPGHEDVHARRLRAEGVAVADGHVTTLRQPRSRSSSSASSACFSMSDSEEITPRTSRSGPST